MIRQGTENKAGTKHSLLRHYGTGVGTVTADNLLLIPEVMGRGQMEEKGRRRVYRLLKDGVRYTVLTERREGTERFCDFYSNKKGDNTRSQNTQLSAQAYSVTTNSAAKVEKESKNPPIPDAKNSETDAEVFLREGDGVVSDAVLSEEKDALDKVKKKGADKADTPEQAIAAEREYANLLSAAEKSLALWNDISAVQSLREQADAEKEQEQKREATNDREKESVGNYVKLQADTEEKDENENAPLHQQEQQHAAADATDAQGNPVNPDGTLKLEKITSVDELTDEDFSNPTRNVELPALPENVDKAIVANGKPVVIKKNIFEKNKRNHSELSPSQSRSILKEALYFTNLYGRTQPKSRPNYWVAIRTSERNKLVVLEVSEKKDNVEIVGWRYAGERQIEELRKQAEREDGQLLILTSTKEAAAGLSTLPSDVSNDKDTQATSDVQAPASENSENAVDKEEDKFKEAVTSLLKALQQEGKTDEEIERDVRALLETFSKPTLNGIISSYLASLNTKNPQHLKALSRLEQALKGMGITVKKGASGIAAGDVAFTSAYDEPFTWYTVQSAHTPSAIKQQKDRINSLVATASNQSLTPTERANALNELRSTIPHYAGKFEQDGQFFDDRVSINEYLDSIEGIKIEGKDKTLPRFKINGYYRVKKPSKKKAAQGKEDKQANDVQSAVSVAEEDVNTSPTEAQKEAGNYKKGHVRIDGFNVTIEQPKGSVRRGTDASGKQWEQEMHNTYGYIRGTEGVDGDHIDVFFSDDPSQGDVFVVDQVNKDGSFDEHKVMYGFASEEEARKAYLSNYEDGWTGLGAITPVSKEEFKKWVQSSRRKTKPFAEYKRFKTSEGQNVSAYKASLRKLADFNVGDVVRDYYNQKLYRIKKHSKSGVSTIAELDAEGNEVGTTTMNTHNNSRYSLAEAPVKAETPTISQDSEQVSDQDNAPYTITPAHKRQHWNSESPLDAMEARLAELKRMAAPEQVYKEFPELAAYMEERDRVFKKYGGEDKVPQDIVKAVLDKYKDVLDRYMNVSDERREECFELEDLIKERKKQQADTTEEKSQEGQADGAMLYHKEADGAADAVTSEEAALRDALMGKLQEAGIEVVTDAQEGQRVLDEANGDARMQAKKRALETVSAASDRQHHQTVVSSADGAKVLNNLDKLVSDYEENEKTHEKTFIGTVANALGAQRKGSKSEYATFETKNGRVVTIRLADHNATVSNFDRRGELDGISIVVSPKKSAGVTNDGEAHVVEYYYDAIKLRRADGKPLADIVRAIKQALYSGEFKDTTGLAERQEVNARELRQSVGVKMQKKPMTAEEQKHKETQLSIIHDTNPAPDDYHTWVRSIDDILTLQEAMDAVLAEDPEYELSTYPDVSDDMIREALRTGRITVYSSKPIKNGVFVTPSMMQAMDYSGGTKVFSKEVPIGNVAWINTDEGQYAATSGEETSQDKEVRFFRTADGHAYGFTVGGKIYIDPRIAKADTPIHEYTHLWAAAVRQGDAKAWADIVRLMQGTPLWDEVAQHYPELADDVDALADEVLAHFSGRRGAERLREAQRVAMEQEGLDAQAAAVAAVERVRQALKRFWRKVADFFGRRFTTAEEVADTVLADMLHGVKPAFDAKDGGVRYDANSEEAGIVARAKADGTYMKAPNGQPSKLTPRQWVQVRTKAFKEWFGDWAKAARIEKLRKSKPIVRKGDEYKGKYELNSRSAEDYVIHSLRGEYPNNDTGDVIRITRASRKVAHHDAENEVHLRSIAYIPEMIKNAVFIEESPNEKGSKFDSYRYYVVGVKIGGVDYTAKLVVGVKDGESYYDHSLTEIEKNNLIDLTNGVKADVSGNEAAPFTGKDKRLLSILQTNSSKVVDENGEPRVVYHGTQEEFNAFDKDAVRERGDGVKGFFFAPAARRESVAGYYAQHGGSIMPVFLNLKRPLVRSTSENLEAPGIADGYDGIISTAASDSENRYYDYEQKRVATERLNKGDIVEIVAFEPSQIKSATDNVGTFDGSNPDIRYQFVGERGAAAMDKAEEASVRLDNLAVAREMEASGKDAKAVKFATGWERGADGKWRYEIGDGKLKEGWKEKAIRVEGASLSDVLDNEELFNAYPQLRSISVSVESLDEGTYGEYRNNTQMIALSDKLVFGVDGVLSHEVQHAIQYIEGFAKGGSPLSVRKSIKGIINEYKDASEYAKGRLRKWAEARVNELFLEESYDTLISSDNPAIRRHAIEKYWDAMNFIDNADGSSLINDYPDMSPDEIALSGYHVREAAEELKRLASSYMDEIPNGNMDALELVEKLEGFLQDKTDKELYKSLGGEVEARNVSKRLGMSTDERRRSLASETEDVAREDQIFLEEGVGVSASQVDGPVDLEEVKYLAERMDKQNGTEVVRFVDFLNRGKLNENESRYFHVGETGKLLNRYGITGKITISSSAANSHHNEDSDHLSAVEWVKVFGKINEPIAITRYGEKTNSFRIYTVVEKNGKNVCVGLNVNSVGRNVKISNIKTGFARDIANALNEKLVYPVSRAELETAIRELSLRHNREVYPEQPYDAAKVVETFENPPIPDAKNSETDAEVFLREGEGVVSDAVLSEENDALGKMGIERTEEERAAFAERERARMERMAHRVAEELGLDEDAVQVVTDVNEITEPKLRKAKGWFDPKTGKITVVIPNHTGTGDVLRTMLHEAVAHKGLRGLFGKRFDVFLDNVYAAADETVRRSISTLAAKHGWDFRRATEEYLAGLAEDMHFEHVSPSFWQKIKLLFLQMLDRLGIRGYDAVTLTDNELRYVLWRSYQHMAHAGRYRSMEEVAGKADAERASEEDDAVRRSLRVGEYSDATADAAEAERAYAAERAADEAGMDVLLREGEEEDAAVDTSGEQMQGGVAATRDALRARALQENAVHQQDFQRKLDAIGRQMGKLRQALAAQRAYDKSSVGILSGLARTMLKLGMLDKMSPSEESRLLTLINAANGKADLTKEVDDLFDLMTKNLLRVSTARLHFRQRQMRACRYADGVLPVCDLKKRTKCWGYSKPRRWLMRVMVSASSFSNCWAWARRWSAMMSLAVRPVSTRTRFPKYPLDRQHLSAK